MSLNITLHNPLRLQNGSMPQAASIGNATAQVVALGQQSTLLAKGALLCLIGDEDQRISFSTSSGYVAPAADGIKLKAGVERWYTLDTAAGYINCVAG